jgi:ankyrin repeat protein
MRTPAPDEHAHPGAPAWRTFLAAYWPLALFAVALVGWIAAGVIDSLWLERQPERQLHRAVLDNDIARVAHLLDGGAEPNRLVSGNSTALHHAAWAGKQPIVELLLSHGADPNVRSTHSGETALHSAVRGNHPTIVARLLEAGAETTVALSGDSEQCVTGLIYQAGSTPEDIATQGGYQEVLTLLRRH